MTADLMLRAIRVHLHEGNMLDLGERNYIWHSEPNPEGNYGLQYFPPNGADCREYFPTVEAALARAAELELLK